MLAFRLELWSTTGKRWEFQDSLEPVSKYGWPVVEYFSNYFARLMVFEKAWIGYMFWRWQHDTCFCRIAYVLVYVAQDGSSESGSLTSCSLGIYSKLLLLIYLLIWLLTSKKRSLKQKNRSIKKFWRLETRLKDRSRCSKLGRYENPYAIWAILFRSRRRNLIFVDSRLLKNSGSMLTSCWSIFLILVKIRVVILV